MLLLPVSYAGLAHGVNTFAVRAIDNAAGNVDPTPASRSGNRDWRLLGTDAFAAASVLAAGGAAVTGTNANATKEAGEPNNAGVSGATRSGTAGCRPRPVRHDRHRGGVRDERLGVYKGSSVSALTKVTARTSTSSSLRMSRVRDMTTAGRTYWIAVDGRLSATGAFTLAL